MKLFAQIVGGIIVLAMVVVFSMAVMAGHSDAPSAASTSRANITLTPLSCSDPAVAAAASRKLAAWITQSIVGDTQLRAKVAVSVAFLRDIPSTADANFTASDGTITTINGDPEGSQRCRVNFVLAFREEDGTLFGGYEPNGFSTQFLFSVGQDGSQITLNDEDMRTATFNEASAIMRMEMEREANTTVQADPNAKRRLSATLGNPE